MRDALSILERCSQEEVEKIDENLVKELVGIPKITYINNLAKAIIENNVEAALATTDEVIKEGKDLQNLLWELIKYVKDVLVYKTTKDTLIYSKEEIENIEELANKCEKNRLLDIIYTLSNISNDMKMSTQKIILFQVGLIKLCNNVAIDNNISISTNIDDNVTAELKQRIANLENEIRNIKLINRSSQNVENNIIKTEKSTVNIQNVEKNTTKKVDMPKQEKAQYVSTGKGISAWPSIVDSFKKDGKIMLYTNLINSNASEINDMSIGISFPKGLTPFGKTILEKSENITEIEKRVSMEFGKPMKIKYINQDTKSSNVESSNPIESFSHDMDIPFNIVD